MLTECDFYLNFINYERYMHDVFKKTNEKNPHFFTCDPKRRYRLPHNNTLVVIFFTELSFTFDCLNWRNIGLF